MTSEIEHYAPVTVDLDSLRYLGLDPENVATRALVLLAQRYQLDPLLGEIQLISDRNGAKLYVTRDGMLAVAHASGHLDGITVDEQRRNSTGDGWTAYVSVWRNDMAHPFRYGAQCKDSEAQARAGNGPEMALARAERRALKRAFRIRSDFYPERPHIEAVEVEGEAADIDVTDARPSAVGATAVGEAAREVSSRPPAPPRNEDEFIAPSREQEAQLRRLRVQLGLMARENAGAWQAVLGRAIGREVTDRLDVSRPEAEGAIAFLTAELAAQAQALADAQRAGVDEGEVVTPEEVIFPPDPDNGDDT